MEYNWSIEIAELNEHVARVAFVPDGVTLGPTFAVQSAEFTPVAVGSAGQASLCGGIVDVRVVADGKTPHAENLQLGWKSGGRDHTWKPGELDTENLGGAFLALDNLWRDYIPAGVHDYDPLVPFDEYIYDTGVLTIELEFAHNALRGRFFETEERNDEVRRMLRGEPSTIFGEWPVGAVNALQRVRKSPPGFFTRSGLTIFRDGTWPWNPQTQWIEPHPHPRPVVLYLIHHDCDWKLLAKELTGLLGPIPRIADRFMGMWYSNYAPFGQKHLKAIAEDFDKHNLPLDIMSVDMDWHGKDWYGYDWAPDFFPDPDAFAAWLEAEDLRGTFNIHPLYIPAYDPRLEQYREATGSVAPVHDETGDWHPYQKDCVGIDIYNQREAKAYFALHDKAEAGGCHFWWIDGSIRHKGGRDETSWLNHAYRAHLKTKSEPHLPIVMARAGGLGAHRDAIVFTGDACSQWEVLGFEVETTVRAAGTLMAYISHDIGGFYHDVNDRAENKPPDDLFVRWFQFGCLSPIMRLHSFNGVREPWRFTPDVLEISKRFCDLRMRLVPYAAKLLDEAHATGVVPVRPMWMEFPGEEDAYTCTHQYMYGPDLLIAPVHREDATARYWLPPGSWHDAFSARTEQGGKWIEEKIALETIPLWLRDGATIELAEPKRRVADTLKTQRKLITGSNWA